MQTKNYWVGDRPGGNWSIVVLDEKTGLPVNLTEFKNARTLLKGSDNELIEFPVQNTIISNPTSGVVTFLWPTESVFTKPGRYILQLELSGAQSVRRTTVQEILIRELGGVTK